MSIEGTIELITNSSEIFWNSGNIIAIIVSVISIIGSIIVVVLNNREAKKISENNNNLQEKMHDENTKLQAKWHKDNLELQKQMNKANIDANLIANARIEWIQRVRNTTAELLVQYFSMLSTVKPSDIQDILLESQEKTELLILFFGHEEKDVDVNVSNWREILQNKEHNDGKNDLLVCFLSDLSQKFSKYCTDVRKGRYQYLEQTLRETRDEMHKNATFFEVGVQYTEEGDEIPVHEPHWQQEDIENVASAEFALKKEKERIKSLQDELIFLRNVMRTYLKIEWKIAKEGK